MKLNYWEVLEGNTKGLILGKTYWCYIIYENDKYIFNNRDTYDIERPNIYYLEDYFRNIYDPTLVERSLFELSTGITLELSNNKDLGENNE